MKLSTGCALLDAKALLREAGLKAGMRYADFGAGTLGHFAFPASEIVGKDGKVWAVDILKGALAGIESRMRLEGTANVKPVWGDIERSRGTGIPDRAADAVSVVNVASLLTKGPGALAEAARVLKGGGTLLVADWDATPCSFGPPLSARVRPQDVSRAVLSGPFKALESFRAGPHHWGLTFARL